MQQLFNVETQFVPISTKSFEPALKLLDINSPSESDYLKQAWERERKDPLHQIKVKQIKVRAPKEMESIELSANEQSSHVINLKLANADNAPVTSNSFSLPKIKKIKEQTSVPTSKASSQASMRMRESARAQEYNNIEHCFNTIDNTFNANRAEEENSQLSKSQIRLVDYNSLTQRVVKDSSPSLSKAMLTSVKSLPQLSLLPKFPQRFLKSPYIHYATKTMDEGKDTVNEKHIEHNIMPLATINEDQQPLHNSTTIFKYSSRPKYRIKNNRSSSHRLALKPIQSSFSKTGDNFLNEHVNKAKSRQLMESKSSERLEKMKHRKSLANKYEPEDPFVKADVGVSEKAKKAMEAYGLTLIKNSHTETSPKKQLSKKNSGKSNIFSLTDAHHESESRMIEKLHMTEKNKEIINKNENKYPKDLLYMRYRYDRDCLNFEKAKDGILSLTYKIFDKHKEDAGVIATKAHPKSTIDAFRKHIKTSSDTKTMGREHTAASLFSTNA